MTQLSHSCIVGFRGEIIVERLLRCVLTLETHDKR